MKKIKLHAIGNDGDFNYYIFDKKNEVIIILNKLFNKIFKSGLQFYIDYENKKGNWSEKERNFEKERDSHESVGLINKRIDVFYGDKKIFVAINCSEKLRLKFNEELAKISTMPEPKKERFEIKKNEGKREKELIKKIKKLSRKKIDELFYLCEWKDSKREKNKSLPNFRIEKIKKGTANGLLETFIQETGIEKIEKNLGKLK